MPVDIVAATVVDMPAVRALFCEYQQWINVDLCFQDFENELAALPGTYAPPAGEIFLAADGGQLIGCAAIRPLAPRQAELKRLYVKPQFQGLGVGKQLFLTAMQRAKDIGYHSIVLDTLPSMKKAQSLYLDYGFEEITPYYTNPQAGVKYYQYLFF